MAEFPSLGEQCGVESCRQLDFLPFSCPHCGGVFCVQHKESHPCTEREPQQPRSANEGEGRTSVGFETFLCSLKDCKKKELNPVVCPLCTLNFCLAHRHEADHNCSSLVEKSPEKRTVAEDARKVVPASTDSSVKRLQNARETNPTAQKLLLMKLKMKAVGDKSTPQSERLYLLLNLPAGTSFKGQNQVAAFVSKEWSIGRTVDGWSKIFGVKNENRDPSAPKLRLKPDGKEAFAMDERIKNFVSQDLLRDGDMVCFFYDS